MNRRSAIILAGGSSKRLGADKGLETLNGRPLVNHVIYKIKDLVDELILVVASEEQKKGYLKIIPDSVRILLDVYNANSPLIGAISGFLKTVADYAFLIGCDYPLLVPEAVEMLFSEAEGGDGASFIWPNGWIEPLNAVYRVEPSLKLCLKNFDKGEYRLRIVLKELEDVRFVPIHKLRDVDPDTWSLFDVDTEENLRKAEEILKRLE